MNDHTGWGSWMTSALGKLHEEVLPSFQQQGMDLVNLVLREFKAVADRDQHKTSIELDETQRQLDQHQRDLDVITVQQPSQASGQ